jgi:hypothetical protein
MGIVLFFSTMPCERSGPHPFRPGDSVRRRGREEQPVRTDQVRDEKCGGVQRDAAADTCRRNSDDLLGCPSREGGGSVVSTLASAVQAMARPLHRPPAAAK